MFFCVLLWVAESSVRAQESPDTSLTGTTVTVIPSDLTPITMTFLEIKNTGIDTLDFSQLAPYRLLEKLHVQSSPVTTVLPAPLIDTPVLKTLHLTGLSFPTPPDIGPLQGQLEYLSLKSCQVQSLPANYFENFTFLFSLSLADNDITFLEEAVFQPIRDNLKYLYLTRNDLGFIPPLEIWTPNLEQLYAKQIGATEIPASLLEGLPELRFLLLSKNGITTLPDQSYFLAHRSGWSDWNQVDLTENGLVCDARLIWLKVIFFSSVTGISDD